MLLSRTISTLTFFPASSTQERKEWVRITRPNSFILGPCLQDEERELGPCVGSQHEELRPWQRSWGRKLGIRKPQETPCSRASTLQTRVLYGELSPITISLGEGVNLQLQVNKNSWVWQECFNLRTPLKVIYPACTGSSGLMRLFTASQLWKAWDVLDLLKANYFRELEIISIMGWLGIIWWRVFHLLCQ